MHGTPRDVASGKGDVIRGRICSRRDHSKPLVAARQVPRSSQLDTHATAQTLPANGASFTAIVRGVGGTTGIGVVEMYALP